MKRCFLRKKIILIITILFVLVCSSNTVVLADGDSSVVFEDNFSNISVTEMYSDWFCGDWGNVSVAEGKLKSNRTLLRRDTYSNYSMSFDILCEKGSHTGFSKVYVLLRQPEGYMISGDL